MICYELMQISISLGESELLTNKKGTDDVTRVLFDLKLLFWYKNKLKKL